MKIKILHLYPKEMNLYGDRGNILTLIRRLKWRGIEAEVIGHEPGDKIPDDINLIFGGGGQDSNQALIEKDLRKIAPRLKDMIEDGVPALVVCGLYQLFGNYFETKDGDKIEGTHIMNLSTKAGPSRLIGNIVISARGFGEVVGYENHSGITTLGDGVSAFGKVVVGYGNNGKDQTEGARYKNCIGTYLHGPILPKNPAVADFLIKKALFYTQGKEVELKWLDDAIEMRAHRSAINRAKPNK